MALANHASSPPPPPSDLTWLRGKVLIVDDEPDIRRLVGMMLTKGNVGSVSVTSADEALEILAEDADDIGLILLDLSVACSGGDPLRCLKHVHPSIPIIIMSGRSLTDRRVTGSYGDSVGFLRKPFQAKALYEALGRRMTTKRESGARERPRAR